MKELSNLTIRSWLTSKSNPPPCTLRSFQKIRYSGRLNCWLGNEESILVSLKRKMSKVFWIISWTDSNLFLIELKFKCSKNKFLGCFLFSLRKKRRDFQNDYYLYLPKYRFFFSMRVFFHGHLQLTGQQGKGGDHILFHSTTPTRSWTFRHLFATLHVRWLSHIFNRTAYIYQTATRWDLPPYGITIWLIDDVTLTFCLFTWWLQCCHCNVCNCKVAMLSTFNIVWFTWTK